MGVRGAVTGVLICAGAWHATVARADGPAPAAPPSWAGTWSYAASAYNASGVTIDKVTPTGFHFAFDASSGMNVGSFEGTASVVTDGIAIGRVDTCTVTFHLRSDALDVSTAGCDGMGGMGVSFDGHYGRGPAKPPPMPTLAEQGILFSAQQQVDFDRLVGKAKDRFVIFVDNGGSDADGFGARVTAGCAPHMCSELESIVMVTPDGKIWAATTDPDNRVILYYSNVADWRNKLPKTIASWASGFEGYTVIYASA